MLDLFKSIADSKGLTFSFGALADLNNFADTVAEDAPKVLFYSCYQAYTPSETKEGYKTKTIPLEVYILSPSDLTDEPEKRFQQISFCADIAESVWAELIDIYTLTNAKITPIITETDNPLDGVSLTATITTNPESLCK